MRYGVAAISSSEYSVVDREADTGVEMCIVNSYDGEAETAQARANKIAKALNYYDTTLRG